MVCQIKYRSISTWLLLLVLTAVDGCGRSAESAADKQSPVVVNDDESPAQRKRRLERQQTGRKQANSAAGRPRPRSAARTQPATPRGRSGQAPVAAKQASSAPAPADTAANDDESPAQRNRRLGRKLSATEQASLTPQRLSSGGSDDESPAQRKRRLEQAEAISKAGPDRPQTAPPAPAAGTSPVSKSPQAAVAQSNGETNKRPLPSSTRPDDVTEWKRDDYYHAKREGDPRLVAAVGYLGNHFAGKESAAVLLTKLLEPPANHLTTADPVAEDGVRWTKAHLAGAIAAALAANGTATARQTLQRIASGAPSLTDRQSPAAASEGPARHPFLEAGRPPAATITTSRP